MDQAMEGNLRIKWTLDAGHLFTRLKPYLGKVTSI